MKEFTANVLTFIESLVSENQLKAHDKIPSERELIKAFSTSRVTLREALVDLENKGIIYRRNRLGWFLAPNRYVIDPAQKSNFTDFAKQQKLQPSTQTLFCSKIPASKTVASQLGMRKGQLVYHLQRVRSVGSRPILLEDIYLSAKRFEGIDNYDLSKSLTGIMRENFGVEITSEENTIAIDLLDAAQATALEVYPGAPCIQFSRLRLDQQGNPAEYDIEQYLHNSIQMKVASR